MYHTVVAINNLLLIHTHTFTHTHTHKFTHTHTSKYYKYLETVLIHYFEKQTLKHKLFIIQYYYRFNR
jgi:hypothetical protein